MSEAEQIQKNFNPVAPEGGWPQGMFPSPIANEMFNPYANPEDRRIYHLLGGSQDRILEYATVRKIRDMQVAGIAYPDALQSIESIRDSSDRLEQQRRIQKHQWPEQP